MKKFLLKIVLIALLAWGAQYISVWFAGPLVALLVNLLWKGSSSQGFFTGLLGVGLLWFGLALYTDITTDGLLTVKMASVLPLKGSRTGLILFTTLIGMLTGGLCGWLGAMVRSLRS